MPVTVQALTRNSNVHVHTCALKTVLHTMRGDKAVSAWVAYVKPFVGSADGKEAAVQSEIAELCDKYTDVFEQTGLSVHCDADHCIDLHDDTAKPSRPRQYCLSAAENDARSDERSGHVLMLYA